MSRDLLRRCADHFWFGFTEPGAATRWLIRVWIIDPWRARRA